MDESVGVMRVIQNRRDRKLPMSQILRAASWFVMILFATACSMQLRFDCSERNSSVPDVPIYSGSTLISVLDESNSGIGSMYYEYQVEASLEEILSFYRMRGICNSYQVCTGDANPFGWYAVDIDESNSGTTSYTIVLEWEKCS